MELNRLRFLMDVQEQIDVLERTLGKEHPDVISAQEKFYNLAGKEFANSVIRLVHEQAVEPVIFKQAQEFYNSLKIYPLLSSEAQKHLFTDFVQMEHQKRRDDFERFCTSVFQQFEYVINEVYENSKVFDKLKIERKYLLFSYHKKNETTGDVDILRRGYSLESQVLGLYSNEKRRFFDDADYNNFWTTAKKGNIKEITQKFKILVYYFYFSEEIFNEERFNEVLKTFEEIKLMRNKVHRGSSFYEKQREIIERVENSRYICYLKYHGFLMDFMNQISLSKNLSLLFGK